MSQASRAPRKTRPSIDALMREYLAVIPLRRRRGPHGGATDSLQLLQHALEGYGYQYLSRADGERYAAARDQEELAGRLRGALDDAVGRIIGWGYNPLWRCQSTAYSECWWT
jgi:hypothetical protein